MGRTTDGPQGHATLTRTPAACISGMLVVSARFPIPVMRFRATQHLRRQREIRGVREQGRRIDCRAFTLWWKRRAADDSKGDAGSGPRVCVIASSAAVGHAVRRNRAKRRLREVFREGQRLVPPGCDLLLIARAAATDAPLPDLQAKFAAACRQIEADGAEVRA